MRRSLLITLALLGLLAGPAAATIVFTSQSDQVWTMRDDGSGQRLLREGSYPSLSPSGARIAFFSVRGHGLFLMRPDGSGLRRLTAGFDIWPRWSPDGRRIAFARVLGKTSAIFAVGAGGRGLLQLTHDRAQDLRPDWAPNGKRIAYDRAGYGRWPQLVTMNPDGSGQRVRAAASSPAWSPDGKLFAATDPRGRVVVMNVDGSGRRVLAPGTGPRWSPDGSRLVFASGTGNPDERPDLYSVAPDGSGLTRLTERPPSQLADWR